MENTYIAHVIKTECRNKSISISKMLEDCDIRKSLIYDLEKRDFTPSVELVEKIADYLNLPLDYLMGRTDSSLTVMESYILRDIYNAAKQENKMPDQVFYINLLQYSSKNTEQVIESLKNLKAKGYIEIITNDFSNSADNRNDLYLTEKGIELLKSYGYYS